MAKAILQLQMVVGDVLIVSRQSPSKEAVYGLLFYNVTSLFCIIALSFFMIMARTHKLFAIAHILLAFAVGLVLIDFSVQVVADSAPTFRLRSLEYLLYASLASLLLSSLVLMRKCL